MRTIFIGDVHGCYRELVLLLNKADFNALEDRLIFLGDLINRGPQSQEVLELVHAIPCEVVLGNHELGLLKYVKEKRRDNPRLNLLLDQMGPRKAYYLEWIQGLPAFIDDPHFLAVHGGLVPDLPPERHEARVITLLRTWGGDKNDLDNPDNPAWFTLYKGDKLVVYGHWAARGLTVRKNTIGLDSGCVWGGALSALILPSRQIVQVKALKTHVDYSS